MGDIFDQVAAQPAAAPAKPDIFDQVAASQQAAPPVAMVSHPDVVDQVTTDRARQATAGLGDAWAQMATRPQIPGYGPAPGPVTPQLPYALQSDAQQAAQQPTWTNPRTGLTHRYPVPGHGSPVENFIDMPITGGERAARGVERMAEPGLKNKAAGASEVLRGAMEAATPLMAGAAVAAPVTTLGTVAAGMATQTASEKLLKGAGVPKEYAALGGDIVGIFGGGAAYMKLRALSKLPYVAESNAIAVKLEDALGRAKDPNASATERGAARAQADALLEGLRKAEAGQPSTGTAAAAAARPTPGSEQPAPQTQAAPEREHTITGEPIRREGEDIFDFVTAQEKERGNDVSTQTQSGANAPDDQPQPAQAGGAQSENAGGGPAGGAQSGAGTASEPGKPTAAAAGQNPLDIGALEKELGRRPTVSEVQRRLKLGYGTASRLLAAHYGETPPSGKTIDTPEAPEAGRGDTALSPGGESIEKKPPTGGSPLVSGSPTNQGGGHPPPSGSSFERRESLPSRGTSVVPETGPGGKTSPSPGSGSAAPGSSVAPPEVAVNHAPLEVHPDIAPYFAKTTSDLRGRPEQALTWVRANEGSFAAGAIPHPELPGGIGLLHGWRGREAPEWRGGFGVAHIDARRPGYLDEAIKKIPSLPIDETIRDQKTGRVMGYVLTDGRTRAVVSSDLRGHATPEWLLTEYEDPASATSSRVSEAPSGSGPTPPETGFSSVPPSPEGAGGAPTSSVTPLGPEVNAPREETRKPAGPQYAGGGLGGLEPFVSESVAEMRALAAKRKAALEEVKAAQATPGEKRFGSKVIQYFTGERDAWGARVNQAISRLRKALPDHTEQEGLALMRDFKGKEEELTQFLQGTHPALDGLSGEDRATAMQRIRELRPSILKALNPTPRMIWADRTLTSIADATLREGQRLGFLDSRWTPEQYNPHILHPKGEGETPTPAGDYVGRALGGKMGRRFAFAEKREFPTLLDAIAQNYKPKTLNAFDAFTIHGDKFATARATHLLSNLLSDEGVGKWGVSEKAPEGWVALAPHSTEFRNLVGYNDPITDEPAAAEQRLFVPKFVSDALRPITDPDYMGRIPVFRALRQTQAYQKAVQLGLSFFHATTENYMALANMGPRGWWRGLRAKMDSPEFLQAERDFIAHGGTTAIQGKTYEAYKSLTPGSIPTWGDIWRKAPAVKQMDELAGAITRFTFDNLQRRFKVTDYQMHVAKLLADQLKADAREQAPIGPGSKAAARKVAEAKIAAMKAGKSYAEVSGAADQAIADARTAEGKQSIAKEINAVYGGLNWENLGVNRATTEVVRALMLAPDWTFSNVFNLKYSLERGTPAGKMARMFWIRQIAGGMAATQMLSLMLSGQLSKNPTQVYFGQDSEGNDVYQNVFFKGASGDAINLVHNVSDYGAVQGLARSMAGKAAGFPRAFIQVATNRDYLGRQIVPQGMNPIAGTVRGAAKTGEALAPIPFSVANLYDMLLGPDAGKYSIPEFLTTAFAGTPPRHMAPDGFRRNAQGELVPKVERPEGSVWDQIRTGRVSEPLAK